MDTRANICLYTCICVDLCCGGESFHKDIVKGHQLCSDTIKSEPDEKEHGSICTFLLKRQVGFREVKWLVQSQSGAFMVCFICDRFFCCR